MQIGADIGKGAPGQRAFKKTGNQHDAGKRIGQYRGIAAKQTASAAAASLSGLRVDREFEGQTGRGHGEKSGKHEEDIAPAQEIAEHAAGGLAEQLAENL